MDIPECEELVDTIFGLPIHPCEHPLGVCPWSLRPSFIGIKNTPRCLFDSVFACLSVNLITLISLIISINISITAFIDTGLHPYISVHPSIVWFIFPKVFLSIPTSVHTSPGNAFLSFAKMN